MTNTPPAAPPATPSAAKAWAAAAALLLSLALAACGTQVTGRAAAPPPPPPPSPSCATAAPNLPTEEDPGTPQPPTEEDPGTSQPPTDQDPGTSQPPTDEDPGTSQPPTDQDTGTPGPPTDGGGTAGSARPCPVVDGWYDMTREFNAYYARHRTDADRLVPSGGVQEVRVRKDGGTGQARVVFTTGSVGKGLGEDARRLAHLFADWRHEVYGDTGTVRVRTADGTPDGTELAALSW
ncbi:hypothetical protein ACFW7J_27515 [Streptomyces sp. NPDC059525]|uniref:hypothetical protein n=1 Tax=Streptomyces sp. NPDC059525 TaxID=3346857 RepID=UPI0036A0D72C